ncbi:MAG: Jag N-terminal domain-containing protein [Desulfobulbales bacterium]|nr:Jag N-terminal domain-containing protein [Desulfobulbales bacterium]
MALHKKMEFEGSDVAEALSKACKALNVAQENLDIEVLTTGTSGIFGLCRQKARLLVSLKKDYREKSVKPEEKALKKTAGVKKDKPKRQEKKKETPSHDKKAAAKNIPVAKAPEPAPESREDIELDEGLLQDVAATLGKILELVNYPSEISVTSEQENVTAQIKGDYVNEITEQNGKMLDSLQYLMRKIIGKRYEEKAIISLDAGNFRAARTEELKKLGLELAGEVKINGKTKSIPSLNPSERRVVHLALQDDKDVRSRSVGEGLLKKVLIYQPGTKGRKGPARKRKGSKRKNSKSTN